MGYQELIGTIYWRMEIFYSSLCWPMVMFMCSLRTIGIVCEGEWLNWEGHWTCLLLCSSVPPPVSGSRRDGLGFFWLWFWWAKVPSSLC